MRDRYILAIETSGRDGSVAIGSADKLLAVEPLGARRRHNLGLMPVIDRLCRRHDAQPGDIEQVCVSLGPGSFTGLRVAVSTAKMLALATGARLIGVPTVEVLAHNAPMPGATDRREGAEHVAVGLNLKRGTVYGAVYRRERHGLKTVLPPDLYPPDQLLDAAPRPLILIADKWPDGELPPGVTRLSGNDAAARAEVVWQIGRAMADRGEFATAATLMPQYVREPEAVTLWDLRQKAQSAATLNR